MICNSLQKIWLKLTQTTPIQRICSSALHCHFTMIWHNISVHVNTNILELTHWYELLISHVLTITSKGLLPFYSFVGDTVYMTLFMFPSLAHLLPFWPSPHTHLWVPMSASQVNTLCQSFFPVKRLRAFPQDWLLKSAKQFPLSSAVPVYMSHFSLSNDRKQRSRQQVCDINWNCLVT